MFIQCVFAIKFWSVIFSGLFLHLILSYIKFERIDDGTHVTVNISLMITGDCLKESIFILVFLFRLGKISVSTKMNRVTLWVSISENKTSLMSTGEPNVSVVQYNKLFEGVHFDGLFLQCHMYIYCHYMLILLVALQLLLMKELKSHI